MQPVPHKRGQSDDRRQAIALATRALIVEKGLEGLRTRDIAQRVGINIATLHYHVPTKEALIALVAESIRTDFHDQALRQERAGKNALGLLRLEFADFLEVVESMPELIIVMTEMMERARRDPVVQQIMAPLHDFWRMQFVEIFQLGISDGSFRPDLDPMSAAFITTGALVDSWRQWTSFSAPVQPLLAELERCFIPQSTVLQG
ncbi:MAG TPA: TetR/AcrR family transcriptional regulator [Devosia sp.]